MLGTLYVVATPIGNLSDITARALDTLREVDLILAEDTRQTRRLLSHYEIDRPLLSYHQQSTDKKKEEILLKLLAGRSLALVTDAGTPGVGDPGNELVDFILEREPRVKIVPIPGPSALAAALSICGMNVNNFIFLGFLGRKKGKKLIRRLIDLKQLRLPLVFFESPYRIVDTLADLIEFLGPARRGFVGVELTKKFERVLRGSLREVKRDLEEEEAKMGRIRGEIVVILE